MEEIKSINVEFIYDMESDVDSTVDYALTYLKDNPEFINILINRINETKDKDYNTEKYIHDIVAKWNSLFLERIIDSLNKENINLKYDNNGKIYL